MAEKFFVKLLNIILGGENMPEQCRRSAAIAPAFYKRMRSIKLQIIAKGLDFVVIV